MEVVKTKRNHLLDIARIVAVLSVVLIHCSAAFVTGYKPHTSEFFFGSLFDTVARAGVPLFLMISGSLFLDENKVITLKSVMAKYLINLVVITIVWAAVYSMLYNVLFPLMTGEPISIKNFILDMVNGHYHMWYLYMIMGLYIITPFLKKFVCRENTDLVLFFIVISFAAQVLFPAIDKICIRYFEIDFIGTWIDKFYLDFFGGYITYYLLGWYIVHVGVKQKHLKVIIYFLSLVSLLGTIFYINTTGDYETPYENLSVFVFIYSLGLFLAINSIKTTFKERTLQTLEKLSKLTFGVYIIHVIVLSFFRKLLPYSGHSAVYLVVCFTAVVCASFIGSYVISKIPVLRKLIRA